MGACWLDHDADGDLYLFVVNQSGKMDSLYRNDDVTFTKVALALGMDMPGWAKDGGGVGCAVGDFDNDGILDLYITSYRGKPPSKYPPTPCSTTNVASASLTSSTSIPSSMMVMVQST